MASTPAPAHGVVGVFEGISIRDYHEGPGASNSDLKLIAQSPAIYYARKRDPERPPAPDETAAQLAGNLLHCALLEPAFFNQRYCVLPEDAPKKPSVTQWNAKKPSPESIAAMDWWTKWGDDNAGKTTISADQYAVAWRQADSLRKISIVREAMGKGHAERRAYAIDEATGLYIKCRPDWECELSTSSSLLLDVKTCGDASTEEFHVQAGKQNYHWQDAYYSSTFARATQRSVEGFLFAAVETAYPYAANVLELGPKSKARAAALVRRSLDTLASCEANGTWPGYTTGGAHKIELPEWALKD
jgi:exodeoxyribonuclease VIII